LTRPPFIYAPPDGPLNIIHLDDDLLVLDKPYGLLTVPGKHEDHRDCLEARAQAEFPEARIVHRLDMDTSGLIVRCDWPNRPLQMVDHETGRAAETAWEIVCQDAQTSDVLLYPKTGRSHQLRVHMLAIGHPIVGDRFYAQGAALEASDRLCLHAERLALYHPNGGAWMVFESVCPF